MNNKETYHIEFLESLKRYNPPLPDNFNEKIDEIINQIKRGKKYEMIYNELEGDYRNLPFSVGSYTLHSMCILKQKYFPKPKKTITIEVEADNENELLEFSEEINNYVNYNNDLPNKKWKWKLINEKGDER